MQLGTAQLSAEKRWWEAGGNAGGGIPSTELHPNLELPLNFSEWVSPWTMLSWVEEEVQQLESEAVNSIVSRVTPVIAQSQGLLGLLAFAYLTGVFDADGILRSYYSDAVSRSLCGPTPPDLNDLTWFRRHNRGLLVTLLGRLMARAVRQKYDLPQVPLPLWLKKRVHEQAVERLDIARHLENAD